MKPINGILTRSDFNMINKLMEIYAKCMLYDIKIKHQEDRIEILKQTDFLEKYAEKVFEQIQEEIELFMEAQESVCAMLNLSSKVLLHTT